MQAAASQQEYEKAASLRDTWNELTFLSDYIDLIRSVRRDYWFVYPVPCHTGADLWALVAGANVVEVIRRTRTIGDRGG